MIPDNATVFIPNREEKERMNKKCQEALIIFLDMPMHEVAYCLQTLIESFQEANMCYIPIKPQKVHLLVNFQRSENRTVVK